MPHGNIFISYRRGPDSNAAGRLYDRLERSFPPESLFFDIDSIPLGVDFAAIIDAEVAKCDVQLVVIGQGWLDAVDRLQNPDDFVRIEIESALKRKGTPVVPLLFDGAMMPTREQLPESLHPLLRRNAILVPHAQFSQIVDGRLTHELKGIIAAAEGDAEAGAEVPADIVPEPAETPQSVRAVPTETARETSGAPPRRRGLRWGVVGALAALAAAGIGLVAYLQQPSAPRVVERTTTTVETPQPAPDASLERLAEIRQAYLEELEARRVAGSQMQQTAPVSKDSKGTDFTEVGDLIYADFEVLYEQVVTSPFLPDDDREKLLEFLEEASFNAPQDMGAFRALITEMRDYLTANKLIVGTR